MWRTWWRWWKDGSDIWIDWLWDWHEEHVGIIEGYLSGDIFDCATVLLWAIRDGLA